MAILEGRPALHLAYRLVTRVIQFFAVDGAAAPGSGLWRAVLPLFVVWDLVVWVWLRRSERFGLGWRISVDSLDMLFWSLSPFPHHGRLDSAIVIAIPLAVEAGVRIGWRGLVVPAAGLAVPFVARAAAGRPAPEGFGVVWLVIGVGLGIGLFRYCRALDREVLAERARKRAADTRRAHLAGQNAVAMGASSVVDVIESVVPILGRPDERSTLWRIACGWKRDLGSATAEDATYLHVALLEWERVHNRHPDLASHATIHLREGEGTTLLTGSQARDLAENMDRLAPRGEVDVRLADSIARTQPPGRPIRLLVAGRALVVPADRWHPRRPVDPGPVAFVFVAAFISHDTSPDFLAVSWLVAGPAVAALVLAALVAHVLLVRRGLEARADILRMSLVFAPLYSAAATLAATQYQVPGAGTGYLAAGPLLLLSFLVGGYRDVLTRRLRWQIASSAALTVAASILLTPLPVSPRDVLINVLIGSTAYFPFRAVSGALARERTAREAAALVEDERLKALAFEAGRAEVVELVRQARDGAREQLRNLAPTLDPALSKLVDERLGEVDERLALLA